MDKTFLKDKIYESMKLDKLEKKRLKESVEVTFCPICGAHDDDIDFLEGDDGKISLEKIICHNCGYTGDSTDFFIDGRFTVSDAINQIRKHSCYSESLKETYYPVTIYNEDYNSDLEEEKQIQKYLDDHKLWGEVEVNDGTVYVEINWGDWKHEHLRCRYLMNDLGYKQDYVEVTEEDGSDCYSAIHTYIKKDMNESLTESLKEEYYPFTFYDEEYNLVPLKTTYNNNGTLAIMVYTDDGEPFGDLTVNLPASDTLADDTHAFVQRDSWVKDFIKQTKIGKPAGKSAKSGFSTFELYEFDINKLDDM